MPAAHLPAALMELMRAGGTITLTDAKGPTVATVTQGGTLKLAAGMTLAEATAVSVKQGATTTSFPLASRASGGQRFVTVANAEGRTQVIPLVAAVNRTAGKQGDSQQAPTGAGPGRRDGPCPGR